MVTGANGYIGRHVVQTLLDLGVAVIAVDLDCRWIDKRAHVVDYDIFNAKEDVFDALGAPDVLIHLAWKDGFIHNASSHLAYLPRHYDFLSKMIAGGLRQLVVMGTMHEVGYYEGSIDESTPTNPRSMYAIAKNALRQAIDVLAQDKNFTFQWLRGYYIVGDDTFNNSIFAKILQAANDGKPEFPMNSGKNRYDFITVQDLALEISLVALQTEVTGIINCCSGTPMALREKVEQFIVEKNLNINLAWGIYPERPYDSPEIYGDCKRILSVVQKAALEDGSKQREQITELKNQLERHAL